jgi:hypothetical protein
MHSISRRRFTAAAGLLAVGGLVGGHFLASRGNNRRGLIRLLPVEGVAYTQSFLRFMERARFDSVRDALSSIRDRSLPVKVAHMLATDLPCPPSGAPRSMVCVSRRSGIVRAAAPFSSADAHGKDSGAS